MCVCVCVCVYTCYRTRHFFNNSNTNEDIATKFEQEYFQSCLDANGGHFQYML